MANTSRKEVLEDIRGKVQAAYEELKGIENQLQAETTRVD